MSRITEPTAEQCNTNAEIQVPEGYNPNDWKAYAYWYPQMGGYTSKSIIVVPQIDPNGCFEAYVWHDGEFPFTADGERGIEAAHLHHCDAEQFIEFGKFVKSKLAAPASKPEGES